MKPRVFMPRRLQMKANNGILIIDDFGRQLMSPRDLLNRWIVPLDRRVDYLMLRYGVKFQIPFELMVVFSTNLEPSDLADEAFLRRIHNKIFVDAVDDNARSTRSSSAWWRQVQLPCEPDSAEYLRKLCLREGRTELRACYPADICNILTSIGKIRRPAADHDQSPSWSAPRRCISREADRLASRSVAVAGRNVTGRKRRAFAEEVLFHLLDQELLRFLRAQVEAVLVHDHLHVLDPHPPGFLRHVVVDALAEGMAFEGNLVESGHFPLELRAKDHALSRFALWART